MRQPKSAAGKRLVAAQNAALERASQERGEQLVWSEAEEAALERAGREPGSLWRSTQALVLFDEPEKAAAIAAKGRPAIGGSAAQLVDQMAAYRDAGVDEFILPVTNLTDAARIRETSDRFLAEVASQL